MHPDTLVLKPLPGYAERLPEKNRIINLGLRGGGAAPRGAFGHDNRLPPRETILGLTVAGSSKAFPLSVLRQTRVINDELAGKPLLIVHQPDSDTTTGYVPRTKDRTLKFTAADTTARELVDTETHSLWNAYGFCISGPLKGTQLERLILEPEFWFAWSEFHPKTAVYAIPTSDGSRTGANAGSKTP